MKANWGLVIVLVAAFGCAGFSPQTPSVIAPTEANEYLLTDFSADYLTYRGLVDEGNLDDARLWRDRMINRIRVDIESYYRVFENELFSGRAGANVAMDFTELAMSGVATVVGGAGVKAAIAAALTILKGTRLSVDQNWFRERTTEAIMTQMRAARDRQTVQIVEKTVELDVKKYPFEEAWADLIELFYAGSLHSAMLEIVRNAGASAAVANAEREQFEATRVQISAASPAQIVTAQKLRLRVNEIRANNDTAEATRILTLLKIPIPAGEDPLVLLDDFVAGLAFDPSQLSNAAKAFGL